MIRQVLECDRCGGEYGIGEGPDTFWPDGVTPSIADARASAHLDGWVVRTEGHGDARRMVDLCPECAKEVV